MTPPPLPPVATPPELPTPKPISRWRWWIHLVLIGCYPVIVAAISWSRLPTRGAALSSTVAGLLTVCGLELLQFSVVFGLGWLASRASRDALLLRWRPGWWVLPLGVGYSVALRMAVGLVMAAVAIFLIVTKVVDPESLQKFVGENRPEVETVVDINAMKQSPAYFWLTITLVSFVVAGLREELWRSGFLAGLRALFPRAFGSRRGEVLAVFLIAVVFGAAHLNMGILAVAMTGVLGIFLGLIMVYHRSIWPAVLAHGFFDATSMAVLPWAMDFIKKIH